VSELAHVTVPPDTAAPLASLAAAENCCVLPTVSTALGGVTVTCVTVGPVGLLLQADRTATAERRRRRFLFM
jgi:hypothetical protein